MDSQQALGITLGTINSRLKNYLIYRNWEEEGENGRQLLKRDLKTALT